MRISVLWAVCRVRAPELEEASSGRARGRRAIVWSLVQRLGDGLPGGGPCAGRRAANVAGGGWLAAPRAAPSRRRAFFLPSGPTLAPETLTRRSGSPDTEPACGVRHRNDDGADRRSRV